VHATFSAGYEISTTARVDNPTAEPRGECCGQQQEFTMSEAQNANVVPVGPGGIAGRIWRFLVTPFTAGFVYPNTCVEGLDLTDIQNQHEGKLYAKK
jgi:hypothetical protein